MSRPTKTLAQKLTEELADSGKIIEGGWEGFRLAVFDGKAVSTIQLVEMRKAFFAGAAHLFVSLICFLEEGVEATETDMDRMRLVFKELDDFQKEFEKMYPLERGH